MFDPAPYVEAGLYNPDASNPHETLATLLWLEELGWTPEGLITAANSASLNDLVAPQSHFTEDESRHFARVKGSSISRIADAACRAATALISEFRSGSVTPRGGLAYGELLTRGGDYYGPIVNLASRIGDLAVPCELLATPEAAERCPDFTFEPAGRRQLKGFGEPVQLVSLNC